MSNNWKMHSCWHCILCVTSGVETTGSLDQMGKRGWEESNLDRALESRASSYKIPHPSGIWCAPEPVQPAHMVYKRHRHAPCAPNKEPWNTSSADALGHLETAGIDGGMTKSSRPSLKPSAQDLCGQSSHNPPKIQSPLSGADDQATPARGNTAGILTSAKDWQLLVDLEQQLKFSSHIAATTLRPDMVLVSESTKQVVLLELTVPWEDHLEEAFERKLSQYAGLVSDC